MYCRAQRLIARHRAGGRSDAELLEDVRRRARSTRRAAEGNVAAGLIMTLFYFFLFLSTACGCNFASTREKAFRAAMKAELRNLDAWQADCFDAFHRYSMTPGRPYRRPGARDTIAAFPAMDDVTVTMVSATQTGWSATASHAKLPRVNCRIAAGDATAPVSAQSATEISCADTHR